MAQPSTREELSQYCLRQLGAPVLEINLADEQIDDLIDDALQYFYERHFDGAERSYIKYQITQADIDRGKAPNNTLAGLTTTTTYSTIVNEEVSYTLYENSNYIQLPENILGVEKVFRWNDRSSLASGITPFGGGFSPLYGWYYGNSSGFNPDAMLSYFMARSYLSEIDYMFNTEKQIRFNKRKGRLYIDTNFGTLGVGNYIIIDANVTTTAADFTRVYNDSFIKRYLTALMKRQWGMNLIKFQGVKLPGGVELNGRQIYEDGQKEVDTILERSKFDYEELPMDLIG